jgi:hypothetical protein
MGTSGAALIAKARANPQVPREPDRNGPQTQVLFFLQIIHEHAMPRFFFHVREGTELSRDHEGQELADAKAARREAVSSGREMLGERLLHGGAIDGRQIVIADDAGTVLDVVNANDVLFQDGQLRSYKDDVTQSAPTANLSNPPRR